MMSIRAQLNPIAVSEPIPVTRRPSRSIPHAVHICDTFRSCPQATLWKAQTKEDGLGGVNMGRKEILDKLSVYVPRKRLEQRPVERLLALSEKRDRAVNYLVVEAILQYLASEENKN